MPDHSDSNVVFIPPCELAFVRVTGPYRHTSAKAWAEILTWLAARGHDVIDNVGYGLALDDPRCTPAAALRYDAGVKRPASFADADLEIVSLRPFHGGAYFKTCHTGSYKMLGRAVSNARNVLVPRAGLMHDASRPVLTLNYSYPDTTAPDAQRAEICIPVLPDRRYTQRD